MTDRPIIFSAPMVRALLDGRKVMTRRLAWRHVPDPADSVLTVRVATPWQRVQPGDRLWVREAFADAMTAGPHPEHGIALGHFYRADDQFHGAPKWRSPIYMGRWLSRLTLTVLTTRVERLQAITTADAVVEGTDLGIIDGKVTKRDARQTFAELWDSLHGAGSWTQNPEVVALCFTVARRNIDSQEAA